MVAQPGFDRARMEAFSQKANNDIVGGYIAAMCSLGDALGLFRILAEKGPSTSLELATRAEVDERYAREWLAALACAGYLEYDPDDRRFALPPEHAAALAQEGGLSFLGGAHQLFTEVLGVLDLVADAFRHGGGVPQSAYRPRFWQAIERCTAPTKEKLLVPEWIPAMPALQTRLEQGALVADVGCGHGRAIVALARAYPNSRFVGYDAYGPAIGRAAANAEAAGVADRVRFKELDAARGIPEQYDVITTFDVIHDAVDPPGLLRAIRRALPPEGTYVLLDHVTAPTLEENAGPSGAFTYSISMLYCM
ncbi:MAG TPA: class I SAM-dependent methyltransferase, partial [Chloroflexota bacterium]